MAKGKNQLDIILNAKNKQLTRIDFGTVSEPDLGVPDTLFELENLTYIRFGNIPINEISENFENLKNLKTLEILESNLKVVPKELMKLLNLRELRFCSKSVIELPREFDFWYNLEYLHMQDCTSLTFINGIPPNLRYLNIGNTNFRSIPNAIFSLKKLGKLVVHNLNLKNVPKDLFKLKYLQSLFIGENQIGEIPSEISNLTELRELVLDQNLFLNFPIAITTLKNLIDLRLERNFLKSIPDEFKNLINLEFLDLSDNDFDQIPTQLKEMRTLRSLNLKNLYYEDFSEGNPFNRITEIPNWLTEMGNLEKLEIERNPIENVPEEILYDGLAAIKNFIFSKLEAEREELLYEAKMVVVGRGNVGKSVLTKKLTIPGYSLVKSDTTKGINILKSPFSFPILNSNKRINFKFNIWDFGGQEKYDATHQLFITSRSVYLFLTEAREESNYSDFQFWLNTIRLFSNDSPVIVILSKCDERKKLLPESLYKEKFGNIIDFVEVSCSDGFEYTIDNLNRIIEKAILMLPQTRQKLSNRWVDIRNELEKLVASTDYISYDTYLDICKKNKLSKTQADFLSQYLNDLGVIVHHQDDLLLSKTVFINTDWCVDGMYKVLDDETVQKNNGKFSNYDLINIWGEARFQNKQEELIKLMKEYHLCFALRDESGYIAPDMLPPDRHKDFVWNSSFNLQFEYHYEFMPAGLLSRFIVKSHSFIKNNLYWKYGVILDYEDTLALVEEDYINGKIKIALKGINKKGLLSAIRMFIEEVHKDFNKNNKLIYEQMVPCNCKKCINNIAPFFYKFIILQKCEQNSIVTVLCEKSLTFVNVRGLINDIQAGAKIQLETNEDLKHFIIEILESVLEKEVLLKDGYINFWRDNKYKNPKNEVEIQPYIANTLDNFCKVRGINLSREVKEASGSVDVLFSYTSPDKQILKVCMEIKKAQHQDVETAVGSQLPLYMKSTGTNCGIYLVIWFKHKNFGLPANFGSEEELYDSISKNNLESNNISVKIINCCKPISPSKR